ncbi:unnamed protein product [Adineta ricciae]|uniref:Uncharacterized protein n=1 Tax=Adineta ricciae TaxID=249248 RepID=A0A813YCY2_ADIRI|nr:unnamed protein product [Adineta ricciae]
MSTIPAIHSWNLTNYARRINPKCVAKNEYFWSCLNTDQSSLKMMITPTLQLIIVSSEQCIEELLDIWLLFNSTHVHVHCKSVLFNYTWPPSCTGTHLDSSQPMKLHSLFFNETKDALALEQSTNMNIRTDFIRQYLSTCLMDPMFCIFVDRNEQMLKSLLSDK